MNKRTKHWSGTKSIQTIELSDRIFKFLLEFPREIVIIFNYFEISFYDPLEINTYCKLVSNLN